MSRPCYELHPLSPGTCPYCAWMFLPGKMATELREQWGEPEPSAICGSSLAIADNGCAPGRVKHRISHYTPGDLLPGIPDPMPEAYPDPIPHGWAWDAQVRGKHVAALGRLLSMDLEPPDLGDNPGIIYVGGGRYWPMIVVGIKMARLFTKLPIQVWYAGRAEPVNSDDLVGVAGVELRDSTAIGYPMRRNGGWENKTTAILHSGFSHVVYLDADAYLVSDPGPLLDACRRSRFCFWSDLPWNDETVDWHWSGVVNNARVPPIQGGQLSLNIRDCFREIVLSHWINQHSPYFYNHQYGDQDSWRVALAATGGQYHNLGAAGWQPPAFVCRYPDPLVVHRCQAKLWGDAQVCFAHDLPWENHVRAFYNDQVVGHGSASEVFARIYKAGMWGEADSSGAGGTDHEAAPFVHLLSVLAQLGKWKECVDLGCGDGRVTTRLPFERIVAVDIHRPHVERLALAHPAITWIVQDLDVGRDDLPAGQVAILKDVLHHWPNALIREWVEWAMTCGKWEWLIFCHDCHQQEDGADCILGGYRALNPSMAPLKGIDFSPVMQFLHKQVLLLSCRRPVAANRRLSV